MSCPFIKVDCALLSDYLFVYIFFAISVNPPLPREIEEFKVSNYESEELLYAFLFKVRLSDGTVDCLAPLN